MTASPFSQDFSSSRQLFEEAAVAAGAHLERHRYPICGPGGEDLSTEVAWIGSAPPGSDPYQRARSWYGTSVAPVGSQASASATIGGDWISTAASLLPHATVTAIAIEFGTVGPLQVLDALRADNWLHAYGDPLASWPGPIKEQIRSAFCVDSDVWRGMVPGQSLATSRQTIAGLQL